jgi:hypothetical protein
MNKKGDKVTRGDKALEKLSPAKSRGAWGYGGDKK